MVEGIASTLIAGAGFFLVWKMVGDWPHLARDTRIGLNSIVFGLLVTSRYALSDTSVSGMMLVLLATAIQLLSARALLTKRQDAR